MNKQSRPITRCSRAWAALLVVVLAWAGWVLSRNIQGPWISDVDYNGAVWSQAAHNILRAGLITTCGESSGFYFGPLPIPPSGYYLHHPPGLHLVLTVLFAFFGEHEWVARMLPISCSLASVILLWLLVRSCAGIRAATLSAAMFACLPMELRYGKMVNFEPPVLMLILGALLCLRYWQLSTNPLWKTAAFGFLVLGMWVDWAMYIFVVVLCIWWFLNSNTNDRRFAGTVLLAALISGFLYLISIRLLRPDAWEDLSNAFVFRIGAGSRVPVGVVPVHFSEAQWITRVATSLITNFLPISWVLAVIGCVIILRERRRDEGLRWLGWACLTVFMMDALFLGVFQNDSYIHAYIAFYLVAPVSIMAGVALDHLITQTDAFLVPRFRGVAVCIACFLLVAVGISGELHAKALEQQSRILNYKALEPPNLIPELGKAIRENFPSDTHVLCNFRDRPQLSYYAQRDLINRLVEYRDWKEYLQGSPKRIGGVVWMGSLMAEDIVTNLPVGTKRFVNLGDVSFCFWKPD